MSTLTEAIQTVIDRVLTGMHTCIPGRIEKYDYTKQQAEVKPLIKTDYNDDTTESMPVISNIPVIFPRSNSTIIHFPLEKGDTGLIFFSEKALENWLSLGGESDSGDKRKFDLSDAIFIPGLYPFSISSLAENNDDCLIKHNGSVVRMKKNGDIEAGGTSFLKLINENFQTMFNNHSHNYMGFVGTGTPTLGETSTPTNLTGGLPIPPPVLPAVPPSGIPGVAIGNNEMTTKVKAE